MKQAATEDPDFASAHIYLAHSYSNLGKEKEAAPHYQRAFHLANAATDRERYFILGSFYDRFLHQQAIEANKVLVHQRLLQLYRKLGREEEARAVETQVSKLLAVADADHPMLVQLKRPPNSILADSSR